MFQIKNLTTGEIFFVDSPRYVRLDSRGVWIRCDEVAADCIAFGGKRFSLVNRKPVSDAAGVVSIREISLPDELRAGFETAQTLEELRNAFLNLCDTVLDWYTEIRNSN